MFFFFNDTATTEIYTLSLHDALPISCELGADLEHMVAEAVARAQQQHGLVLEIAGGDMVLLGQRMGDRKSTRLNSSHGYISYAVFCLNKKTPVPFERTWSGSPTATSR